MLFCLSVWLHTSLTSFTISISASHATTRCVTCGDFVVFLVKTQHLQLYQKAWGGIAPNRFLPWGNQLRKKNTRPWKIVILLWKKKMIFLIIHVKFPGWTKDKNQKFQRFMSPLKHHKRPCENKTDHFEPLSWWCIANHGHEHRKADFTLKYWWRFRSIPNSDFSDFAGCFCWWKCSDIGLSICTWSAMDGVVRYWF